MAVLLSACVADDVEAPKQIVVPDQELEEAGVTEEQICAAAAALPSSDVCSLVCDPDAFRSRLKDDGMKSGTCYQFRCNLTAEMSVTVGVCLP